MKGCVLGDLVMNVKNSILVIDDETNLRKTLASILTRSGYQVTTAADGQSALKALKASKFDLVIVDVQLPDIGGIRLSQQIYKKHPGIPVIIFTARPESEINDFHSGKNIGAYLVKPVDPEVILNTLEKMLHQTT